MTDEINNLNTDFKELFVDNKLEELTDRLDNTEDSIVIEILLYNYDIIKKYYEAGKYNLLIQFIKFVAFSSFMCEYGAKKGLLKSSLNDEMTALFSEIYLIIQKNNND